MVIWICARQLFGFGAAEGACSLVGFEVDFYVVEGSILFGKFIPVSLS